MAKKMDFKSISFMVDIFQAEQTLVVDIGAGVIGKFSQFFLMNSLHMSLKIN